MMTFSPSTDALEPAAREVALAGNYPPSPFDLDALDRRRKVLDELQRFGARPRADVVDLVVPGGPNGRVPVRIVTPTASAALLPVVLYVHGAGWVFGGKVTHDRLIRELAVGSGAAVVFVDYRRSPEVRYPSQLEECWTVARWIVEYGEAHGLDGSRLGVAGDGVGGNMSAALTLLATERDVVELTAQVLFHPVTDSSFDTESYHEFAEGYGLRRDSMQWFWDHYTTYEAERDEITASPLRASVGQLADLPTALVITAEADVVRDEGEAYARKLRSAGVEVLAIRYEGVVHDFVWLNALRRTRAAGSAIAQASSFLRATLGATV